MWQTIKGISSSEIRENLVIEGTKELFLKWRIDHNRCHICRKQLFAMLGLILCGPNIVRSTSTIGGSEAVSGR